MSVFAQKKMCAFQRSSGHVVTCRGQDPKSKVRDLDNRPIGRNSGWRGWTRLDARVPLLPWINQTVEGKSRNGQKT